MLHAIYKSDFSAYLALKILIFVSKYLVIKCNIFYMKEVTSDKIFMNTKNIIINTKYKNEKQKLFIRTLHSCF